MRDALMKHALIIVHRHTIALIVARVRISTALPRPSAEVDCHHAGYLLLLLLLFVCAYLSSSALCTFKASSNGSLFSQEAGREAVHAPTRGREVDTEAVIGGSGSSKGLSLDKATGANSSVGVRVRDGSGEAEEDGVGASVITPGAALGRDIRTEGKLVGVFVEIEVSHVLGVSVAFLCGSNDGFRRVGAG